MSLWSVYVCVQEVVQGSSLAQMVSSGKRASEEEVLRIATDLLATLKYLAGAQQLQTLGAAKCGKYVAYRGSS
jgi:hypothetical protein